MTVTNPPFALQGSPHGAQLFREAVSSQLVPAGGVIQSQDLALTQNGTPNMSVNVGAGRCWVPGTSLATVNPGGGAYHPQGLYFAENDASVNLPVSASSPSNPRIDTVVMQIQDAFYTGITNSASLAVLTGTPTTGATLVNLSGAASVPVSSLVLGYVLVPANATTIVTADISNTVALETTVGAQAIVFGTHAARPAAAAMINRLYYETDTGLSYGSDGTNWNLIKPGAQLGYAEITSVFSTATLYSSFAAVTGLSTTVTVGARPIRVIFDCSYYGNLTAGDAAAVAIYEDGTAIAAINSSGTKGVSVSGHREVRRSPAAGSHTYDIRLAAMTGGSAHIGADTGTTYGSAFIQVMEI